MEVTMSEKPAAFDLEVVASRIAHDSRRIHQAAVNALHLCEIWITFNDAEEQRRVVGASPTSLAAAVYEEAVLQNLVLIAVRLFDKPRGCVVTTDRISFPVIQGLLSLPGVSEMIIDRAQVPLSAVLCGEPDRTAQEVPDRIDCFHAKMRRLATEKPNRMQLLRGFRDENIAHELHLEPTTKPEYGHVTGMVSEILSLTEDMDLILNGSRSFPWQRGEASKSAAALWSAVVAAFPFPQ
jgi:hypothetical protein